MSGFNLPPGCSVFDIPGNRPDDVLADRLREELTDEDITTTHADKVDRCDRAIFARCDICGGTGHERTAPDEAGPGALPCEVCDGSGWRFIKCCVKVVTPSGKVGDGDPTDCPYIETLLEQRLTEALDG